MHANMGEAHDTENATAHLAGLLTSGAEPAEFWQRVLEYGMEATRADLAGAYTLQSSERNAGDLLLLHARGVYPMPETLSHRLEFVSFLRECGQAIVLARRRGAFFLDTLVHSDMQSSIVLPLRFESWEYGALVFNSTCIGAFGAPRFQYMDRLARAIGALLAVRRHQPDRPASPEALARVEATGSSS
jgi:hypothetical protein